VPHEDTIAAIATPFGSGGVGIIRVSGPDACKIALLIFRPSQPDCSWETHHLYHGDIIATDGKTILDEVLISFMRGPHSFTGEDILEINCHGSPVIMQVILSQLVKLGCRPARPGEFSQRAFLNDRIDLSQAEALAAIVNARSEKACAIGMAQLKGALSSEMESLRQLLIEAVAQMEALIDFAEDVSPEESPAVAAQIDDIETRLELLIKSYQTAKIYTEGINIIITGKPNVGKSSLLNTLTGSTRAIVTDIPGTTRDLITATVNIRGLPVNLTDTAGIRKPRNVIEEAGIDLAWKNMGDADLVIVLLDKSRPLTEEDHEIITAAAKGSHIIVVNKNDLPASWEINKLLRFLPDSKIMEISARFGSGIDELRNALADEAGKEMQEDTGTILITNMRQKLALEKACGNIRKAKESIACGLSSEFAVFDLREALDSLDEITGLKINNEILDKIFSSFCIGK
jgi:tRNA modification GTPase